MVCVPEEGHFPGLGILCFRIGERNGQRRIAAVLEPSGACPTMETDRHAHQSIDLLVDAHPSDVEPMRGIVRIPDAPSLRRDGTEDDGTQRQHDGQNPNAAHERPLKTLTILRSVEAVRDFGRCLLPAEQSDGCRSRQSSCTSARSRCSRVAMRDPDHERDPRAAEARVRVQVAGGRFPSREGGR